MPAWLLALFLACLFVLPARAETAQSQPEQDNALANALVAYEAGDLVEAQRWFERAHKDHPTARTLRGLGIVAYRQGRLVDAYAYLSASLASTEKPLTEALRASVLELVNELRVKLSRITFQLYPATAALRIDEGDPVFDASGAVVLMPGSHRATLSAPGHAQGVWRLEAEAGSNQLRSWQLAPIPEPIAQVSPPLADSGSATSAHPTHAPLSPPPAAKRLRRGAYGALAAAAAGLVITSVSMGLGISRVNSFEAQCRAEPEQVCSPAQAEAAERDGHLQLLSGLSIGGAVVAGLGAVASTWLFVAAARADSHAVSSLTVGAGVQGAF